MRFDYEQDTQTPEQDPLTSFANSGRPLLNLSRRSHDLPVRVPMEAFFEFTFWMSEELLDLEAAFGCSGGKV